MLRRVKTRGRAASQPKARVLSVDDWAWRKKQRYGTMLMDLERSQVIDLLPVRAFCRSAVERDIQELQIDALDADASNDGEGCGINEYSGTGTFSGNEISDNVVSDAYCGVAHVTADWVHEGVYFNILYTELNTDLYLLSAAVPADRGAIAVYRQSRVAAHDQTV